MNEWQVERFEDSSGIAIVCRYERDQQTKDDARDETKAVKVSFGKKKFWS